MLNNMPQGIPLQSLDPVMDWTVSLRKIQWSRNPRTYECDLGIEALQMSSSQMRVALTQYD